METTGFDFSDLCDDAVQRAGGETATAEDIVKVRRALRIILERWAALRYNTWRIASTTVGIGQTPVVRLPKEVDDVLQVNAQNPRAPIGSVGSESIMRRIGPQEYAQLTNKMVAGQPAQYYLNRTQGAPELYVFPIGRPNVVETLEVWYVARPAAFDTYSNEVDAPGRWLEALVCGVALELARKRVRDDGTYDENLIMRLKSEADEANLIAQNADRSRHRYRFRIQRR